MKIRIIVITALLLLAPVAQLAQAAQAPDYRQVSEIELENLSQPASNRFSSAQPSQAQLQALADAGVKHIVSLRPVSELDWDEQAVVESLGMTFHRVPVDVPNGINQNNAESLSQVLANIGDESALLHCASGNRVGAMVALKHGADTGDIETAVTLGQAWGMTRLETMVREKLQSQ